MTNSNKKRAFTLIELMICLAIISIIILTYTPKSQKLSHQAKCAALKQGLLSIRTSIQEYYKLKSKYPISLNTLVSAGLISRIPEDPFTGTNRDWTLIKLNEESNEICDVKSSSDVKDNAGESVSDY